MAMKSDDLEADAIDDAFKDKLGDLFKLLVGGLIDGREQKSVEAFTNGANYARRARELALEALKTGPDASARTRSKAQKV